MDEDEYKGMWISGEPSLHSDLRFWYDNLYQEELAEYRDHLLGDLPEEERHLHDIVDSLADSLIKGVTELTPDEMGNAMDVFRSGVVVGDSYNRPNVLKAIFSSVEEKIGDELVDMARPVRERWFNLAFLAKPITLTPSARTFLQRVARCYLFGFDAECIAMCRGALDSVFQSEISADQCFEQLGERPSRRNADAPSYSLDDRIQVAKSIGRLSSEGAELARTVKTAANSILHRNPTSSIEAGQAIAGTLSVMEELSSA